jgi:hypothetical protein
VCVLMIQPPLFPAREHRKNERPARGAPHAT